MRIYTQDPSIYRGHFTRQVGGELPGFKGARVQHADGIGSFLGALARKAIPLLKAGYKIVAPHVKQAGKDIAKDITGRVIQEATKKMTGKAYKRRRGKRRSRRRKTVKRATSNDIFMQ